MDKDGIKENAIDVTEAWQGDGTSIFDPVLCEICYRWFNLDAGEILDPFAGGSVRGIVAGVLNMPYTGFDIRQEQVDANREQVILLKENNPHPTWICHDSVLMDEVLPEGKKFDLVFTCPPYGDLEVYSDMPGDISNMDNIAFLNAYGAIIAKSYDRLHNDRFMVLVVGDYRGKDGSLSNFVGETISAALKCGFKLYNEIILATALGSLPIRAGKQFQVSRKIGKTHQNVLVFYKGNIKNIKGTFGSIDCTPTVFEEENGDN